MKPCHMWILSSCIRQDRNIVEGTKATTNTEESRRNNWINAKNQTNIRWHLKMQKAASFAISRNFCQGLRKHWEVREKEGCTSSAVSIWSCRDATRVQLRAVLSKEFLMEICAIVHGLGKSRTRGPKMSANQNTCKEELIIRWAKWRAI